MSISSADFHRENQILFQAKIVHSSWDMDHISKSLDLDPEQYHFKDADVIDLSGNKKGDVSENFGVLQSDMFYREPVLEKPYSKIEEMARGVGTEVLTREDAGDLNVKNQGFVVKEYFYRDVKEVETYIRSLDSLVRELKPHEEDARWAIDTTSQEFLIYKPRSGG